MSSFCALSRSTRKAKEDKWWNDRLVLQNHDRDHIELSAVPPVVHEVLRSPSQPLDENTRALMETRFGFDFGEVRVHADSQAGESAKAIDARAYTVGRDVVFGTGHYAPETTEGKRLLAHELTHVLQQTNATCGFIARQKDTTSAPKSPETKTCNQVELFTEIILPWWLRKLPNVNNPYFHGSEEISKDEWKALLESARKNRCEAKGEFKDIPLKWDLGNPKLRYILDINKMEIKPDISLSVIHLGEPCGNCFYGTLSWELNVKVSIGAEKGETKEPIKGTKEGKKCDGRECCVVNQTIGVNMSLGNAGISLKINGTVTINGATYRK